MKNCRYVLLMTIALVLGLLLSACSSEDKATAPSLGGMEMGVPADLDTATTRASDQGLFRATITSQLDPIVINRIHDWTFHVETVDGKPVENANVTVNGGMPQHDHGFPTVPEVTQELGDGDYQVEGMKFQMGGWWEITFDIEAGGQRDSVTFNLILQ